MDHEILMRAYQAALGGQSAAIATIVESTVKGTPRKIGAQMIVLQNGGLFGTIGGGRNELDAVQKCAEVIKTGNPICVTYDYFGQKGQSVCGGQIKVFIQPLLGKKKFIICGGGHIALPLSVLGKMAGFNVTVVDSRKNFANVKRFPHIDKVICGEYKRVLARQVIDADTYIMIVTHGNEHDFECLKSVASKKYAYLGVISSGPKKVKFFKRLKEMGLHKGIFETIDIPAGVDIGAQTPEEIAVSIMAGIISQKNRTHLGTSKFKEKAKH